MASGMSTIDSAGTSSRTFLRVSNDGGNGVGGGSNAGITPRKSGPNRHVNMPMTQLWLIGTRTVVSFQFESDAVCSARGRPRKPAAPCLSWHASTALVHWRGFGFPIRDLVYQSVTANEGTRLPVVPEVWMMKGAQCQNSSMSCS